MTISSKVRRLALGAAATLSAAVVVGTLAVSPALADSHPQSLPDVAGHTCVSGTFGSYKAVFCADLGLYTASSGSQFITLQAEEICQTVGGAYAQCERAGVAGTVANGAGYTDWGSMDCIGNCQNPSLGSNRNYFYPFGGLPISRGTCDNNVWGVMELGSQIQLPNGGLVTLQSNLGTPHFNVCETSSGVIQYS